MCDALSLAIASFATQAGSAVMQHQANSAQAKIQTRMHEINQQNALVDMQRQMADAGTRQLQEYETASAKIEDRRRQALVETSQARAAIGETGASGFTMSALLSQVMGNAGRDVSRIETNRDWTIGQLEREKEGIRAQTISRMNSTPRGVKPSGLATALQIGSAGVSSYAGYKTGKLG